MSTITVLHLVYDHCLPSCLRSLSSILSTSIAAEILVRFNSSNFEIVEDASSLDVYFEVVREVSPGVYAPAEYTFDFQLQVTTITVDGSATGECTVDSYSQAKYSVQYCVHCSWSVDRWAMSVIHWCSVSII